MFEAIKAYHADKHLQQLAAGLAQDGASALAEEQGRTWDVLMRILDQLATVLPEKPMALKDYCALYALVTHTEDLGEIPMGLDNVQVGQADRMRFNNPRALFILGANEGEFPQRSPVAACSATMSASNWRRMILSCIPLAKF